MSDIADVSLDGLRPWVKSSFRVSTNGLSCELELAEAVPLSGHRVGVGEKFSLLFRGTSAVPLTQRMYRFEHPEAGQFDLFIVPVACHERGVRHYEAIINRDVPA